MKIWVDADACPAPIKEILFRAAERTGIELILVANHGMRVPRHVRLLQVPQGFDMADREIAARISPGDLVVTADIPLAADVIDKGGQALDPRGELHAPDTIRARLGMRDFMETLRASGVATGGPPALSQSDRKNFADRLDQLLNRYTSGRNR